MFKKTYRIRILFLGFLSLLVFSAIIVRLYYLQVLVHTTYEKRARAQQNKSVLLTPCRGDILDRNGITLATSFASDTVVLDTRKFEGAPDPRMLRELAETLHRPEETIANLFKNARRHYLARKISEEDRKEISVIENRYKVPPGVFIYEKNSKRTYPKGSLASHVLGYTKIDDNGDNIGQAGLELQYNEWLKGKYIKQSIPVTSGQKGLAPLEDEVIEATHGSTLVLTIDEKVQSVVEQAIRQRVGEVQAKGGIAVVMDVATGEILALASCPDFDPNEFTKAAPEQLRNRILTDPIEIGSVMKIITTTLLLDRNLVKPDEIVDCKGGYWAVPGRTPIKDAHKLGAVPFREAFAESSNIGIISMAMRLESNDYYNGLLRFGLGAPSGIDLPGEGSGILYPVEKWSGLSRYSLPMGYETALTASQVIDALGAIGNGGRRLRPHLVREIRSFKKKLIKTFEPEMIEQVASPETCNTMHELMEGVVTIGTGKQAAIPGMRIGGKTGTSVKGDPRAVPKKYISSFAGLMPIDKPRLAVYIYIDEPAREGIYGGAIAGPVFKQIAVQIAHLLDIRPADPVVFEEAMKKIEKESQLAVNDIPSSDTMLAAAAPVEEPEDTPQPALPDGLIPEVLDDGSPRMPDCKGMTIVEAWAALERAGIKANVVGSGVVVRQEPPAGAPSGMGQTPTIILAHPSEIRTVATPTPTPTPTPKPTPTRKKKK